MKDRYIEVRPAEAAAKKKGDFFITMQFCSSFKASVSLWKGLWKGGFYLNVLWNSNTFEFLVELPHQDDSDVLFLYLQKLESFYL